MKTCLRRAQAEPTASRIPTRLLAGLHSDSTEQLQDHRQPLLGMGTPEPPERRGSVRRRSSVGVRREGRASRIVIFLVTRGGGRLRRSRGLGQINP